MQTIQEAMRGTHWTASSGAEAAVKRTGEAADVTARNVGDAYALANSLLCQVASQTTVSQKQTDAAYAAIRAAAGAADAMRKANEASVAAMKSHSAALQAETVAMEAEKAVKESRLDEDKENFEKKFEKLWEQKFLRNSSTFRR